MNSNRLLGLLAIGLVALAPVIANAQISTGDIYGACMDETGGILPGVTVTLSGPLIGTMTQTTGVNGDFHFIKLSPGTYDIQCALESFATYSQKLVRVEVGGAVNLKFTLKPATAAETITVTAEQPILDTKKTGVGQNLTQETLANIPTARDPWVVLSMVSGIVVDRVNIAGAESGQQSIFTSRGDVAGANTAWNIDGVTVSDTASGNSSPTYYDFDAFEEIQVTTGGNDPSQATGGVGINFVTKQGGDLPKGSARFYTTSEGLQGDNTKGLSGEVQRFTWNPLYVQKTKIVKSRDYGIELGGPIVKDKAWYWGAVGVQDIQKLTAQGSPDNTQIENVQLKGTTHLSEAFSANYMFFRGNKVKRGRDAGPKRPQETTRNQSGPTSIHKIEGNYIVSPNLYLAAKVGIVRGGFHLAPAGGLNTNAWLDSNLVWHNSWQDYDSRRPQIQISADGTHFRSGLGGNHEFKFGFAYRNVETESIVKWPGDGSWTAERTGSQTDGRANFTRPADLHTRNLYTSFWAGDTFTRNRLTLNLGLRYDQQKANLEAATAPGSTNPVVASVLPTVSLPAQPAPFTWKNFSPRLGFTYDVAGDGKTLVRGNFSMYSDQLLTVPFYYSSPFSAIGRATFHWTDLNGDHIAQANELGSLVSRNFDPNDPLSTNAWINPNLKAPKRTEFIIGGEREVMQNFSIGGNFVYRKLTDTWWYADSFSKSLGGIVHMSDFEIDHYETGTLPGGGSYNVPIYRLKSGESFIPYLVATQRPDYSEKYQGVELFATKRLSNKWMLNLSMNIQTDRGYKTSDAAINLPTNIGGPFPFNTSVNNGEDLAFTSAASGISGYWISTPKWQISASGMYQLPQGITAAANLIGRQGFPNLYAVSVNAPVDDNIGRGGLPVIVNKTGDSRLPNMIELDARVSKTISLGDKGNINLDLDIFNLLNRQTVLHVDQNLGTDTIGTIDDIMYPRTVRLGVRYSF